MSVLAVLALLHPGAVAAQEQTGRVEGWVAVPDGGVPDARIEISGPALLIPRETASDQRGYFQLHGVPVGRYRLRAVLLGYRPVSVDSVTVELGRTTSLDDLRLEPQALQLGELVVTARRPPVDLASAATVTNLAASWFSNVPTDRNFRSIVSLAPQANVSFLPDDEANIGGGTGPENAYFLDGVNITEPVNGATSANLPYNFVREIQVKAAGYEAEYGRATGGIVDVVTRSGGNRFGGQVFGFYTGQALSADPRFALPDARAARFAEYDVGGSVGGPLARDRLWFFAAYNPSFRRETVALPGVELPDETRTQHLFASKLDWQAGRATKVTFIVHGDPGSRRHLDLELVPVTLLSPDPVTDVGRQGGVVVATTVHHRLGARTELEVTAAHFTRADDFEAVTGTGRTTPLFIDFETGTLSGGIGATFHNHGFRRSARAKLTATRGSHELKLGVEFEQNRLHEQEDGSAEPGSPGGIISRFDDTTFTWTRISSDLSVHNRTPTLYAQDSWQVGRRIRLNLGLRWDGQYLTDARGAAALSITDEWQPRVGLIYQLTAGGGHKLFGSYGRFYEQLPLHLPFSYYDNVTRFVTLQFDHDPRLDPSGGDTAFSIFGPQTEPRRDLEGQHYDEVTLGYEGVVGRELRASVRGVFRRLRWAIEDAFNPEAGGYQIGNPGRGNLAFAPKAKREYSALVVTVEKPRGDRFDFLASYVLSRTWGNYEGLYDFQALNETHPNTTIQFDFPEQFANGTGLLPNDRTHVVKLSGSYRLTDHVRVGTAATWSSGTPRNELGATTAGDPFYALLRPRGSSGRTSSVLDANLRVMWSPEPGAGGFRPTLLLDVFHLVNLRTAVRRDDRHYVALDDAGNQGVVNPAYNRGIVFQPPMSARVGVLLEFGDYH